MIFCHSYHMLLIIYYIAVLLYNIDSEWNDDINIIISHNIIQYRIIWCQRYHIIIWNMKIWILIILKSGPIDEAVYLYHILYLFQVCVLSCHHFIPSTSSSSYSLPLLPLVFLYSLLLLFLFIFQHWVFSTSLY